MHTSNGALLSDDARSSSSSRSLPPRSSGETIASVLTATAARRDAGKGAHPSATLTALRIAARELPPIHTRSPGLGMGSITFPSAFQLGPSSQLGLSRLTG